MSVKHVTPLLYNTAFSQLMSVSVKLGIMRKLAIQLVNNAITLVKLVMLELNSIVKCVKQVELRIPQQQHVCVTLAPMKLLTISAIPVILNANNVAYSLITAQPAIIL